VAITGAAVDPGAYKEWFKDDHSLHKAPYISMSKCVVKCQMCTVPLDLDAAAV
jgi:hypothetical protein